MSPRNATTAEKESKMKKSFQDLLKAYQTPSKDGKRNNSSIAGPTLSRGQQIWQRIQRYQASHPSRAPIRDHSKATAGHVASIGLLFIIVDQLPHELIWQHWLAEQTAADCTVKIWIHAKYPQRTSPWVQKHLVKSFQLQPEWGSIQLTQTMLLMLYEAMKGAPDIDKFAFVSESCLPVLPLSEALQLVYAGDSNDASWIKHRNSPNNGYAKQLQWDAITSAGMPSAYVSKADQWLLLSRWHLLPLFQMLASLLQPVDSAESIDDSILPIMSCQQLLHHDIFQFFTKVRASDEMFFPTLFSVLGILSDGKASISRRLTYCDWSANGRSPESYAALTADLQQRARAEGCLFIRKVVGSGQEIHAWQALVYSPMPLLDEERCVELVDESSMEKEAGGEVAKRKRHAGAEDREEEALASAIDCEKALHNDKRRKV